MAWSVILSVSFFFIFRRCGFSSAGVRDALTQPSSEPWLGKEEKYAGFFKCICFFFYSRTVLKDGGGGGEESFLVKKNSNLYQKHTNGLFIFAVWLNINFIFVIL